MPKEPIHASISINSKGRKYFLTIKDLQDRSGESFTYRLSIRQPVPDFAVKVLPDTPRAPGRSLGSPVRACAPDRVQRNGASRD
jgi:hypothetical protein